MAVLLSFLAEAGALAEEAAVEVVDVAEAGFFEAGDGAAAAETSGAIDEDRFSGVEFGAEAFGEEVVAAGDADGIGEGTAFGFAGGAEVEDLEKGFGFEEGGGFGSADIFGEAAIRQGAEEALIPPGLKESPGDRGEAEGGSGAE
jgi:hypothetical protein